MPRYTQSVIVERPAGDIAEKTKAAAVGGVVGVGGLVSALLIVVEALGIELDPDALAYIAGMLVAVASAFNSYRRPEVVVSGNDPGTLEYVDADTSLTPAEAAEYQSIP